MSEPLKATILQRYRASTIDSLILAPVLVLSYIAALATDSSLGFVFAWLGGAVLVGGAYETFFLVRRGQTPGRKFVGIVVRTRSGNQVGTGRAILRWFVKLLGVIPIVTVIDVVVMAVDSDSRMIHDFAARTTVVQSTHRR